MASDNDYFGGLLPSTEDSMVFAPPTLDAPKPTARQRSIASVGTSKQWKEIQAYLLTRRELYTRQLPGGELFKTMKTNAERGEKSAIASCVIDEIDNFIHMIEETTNGLKG